MNSRDDPGLPRRTGLRIGLLVLVATALGVGLWALFLPRVFYDDFPFPGREWVSTLGPYNEHLVRDYGELNLALAVLLAFAAIFLERRLVQASLLALLAYAVPHFIFQVTQMHHFSPSDNVAQLVSLGLQVLLPLALLFLATPRGGTKDPDHTERPDS